MCEATIEDAATSQDTEAKTRFLVGSFVAAASFIYLSQTVISVVLCSPTTTRNDT